MKTSIISLVFLLFALTSFGQNESFDYFGFSSPGNTIELFAPDIVSLENLREKSLAISPLGDEVFFASGIWPNSRLMHVKKNGSEWSNPQLATFCMDCFATEPAFSPDGKYLYFSSSKGMEDIRQYCIWRVEKEGDKWVNPKKVIDIDEPYIWEFHPSITNEGTVYFCFWDSKINEGLIYKSEYLDDIYSEPEEVAVPFERGCSVTDPFVDPAGRFLLVSAETGNNETGYDTFISYRDGGRWSEPISFGDRYNTSGDDDSFDISPDGKFIFIYKEENVYWSETKGIIK